MKNSFSEEEKIKISDFLKEYIKKYKINQSQLAKKVGVDKTYISYIINRKWNKIPDPNQKGSFKSIGDKWFEKINKQLGIIKLPKSKVHLFSENYSKIAQICDSTRSECGTSLIDGRTGIGKTFALESYQKKNSINTYYVQARYVFTAKTLLEAIGLAIDPKFDITGSANGLLNRIITFLSTSENPLVIVDEAEHIFEKKDSMGYLLSLMDCINRSKCIGLVISGMNFYTRLEEAFKKEKPIYTQFYRRIKTQTYHLGG